ncbi:MAG: response regulator [Alphaproteobacteria bacterium]|nr:response regulator [Alphaproteobacteria bacterium]MBU6473636.1 response regulator [Alphaproteobacteria bacterium]MDE2072711.1 response regulator [Alphaproteobacteria bacterium]
MKHCLVVEDSRVIRKVACRILESLHIEAEEAEDAASALEACRRQMPDLVLLDWNMPGSGGLEFLRGLRREPGGTEPVVIFCTTENDLGQITEAMMAGADEFVLKPYDGPLIETKLAQIGAI